MSSQVLLVVAPIEVLKSYYAGYVVCWTDPLGSFPLVVPPTNIFIPPIRVVVRMGVKGIHTTTNEYEVTLRPVRDSADRDAGPVAVVITARSVGEADKVWNLPFSKLKEMFNYRFPPLSVAQMILTLHHGNSLLVNESYDARELLELGYRPIRN